MHRQLLARLLVLMVTVFIVVFAINVGVAGRQHEPKRSPLSPPSDENPTQEAQRRLVEIERLIARYDLTPHPAPAIPDNPPPHEGAMIDHGPYVIDSPDLMLVEVLEALPGRPISGERLVRPDGTIALGFYGDVYVKGLTLNQAKVAIIKHLRQYLNDTALGLQEAVPDEEASNPFVEKPPISERPGEGRPLADPNADPKGKEVLKPRSSSYRSRPGPRTLKTRPASSRRDQRPVVVRPVRFPETSQEPADPGSPARRTDKSEPVPHVEADAEGPATIVPPDRSLLVYVDVTAYNSTYYYVQGDVLITGRLNCTGNETVLDALNFAGGLLPTAEPKDIQLVRPGRGGKPSRVYKVDLEAIQQKGEVATNYQLFAGDRLIVGRNEVVKKTIEIDRLNAPIQSLTSSILQEAFMLRSLQFATASDRNQLLKEYVEFWAKELARPGGVQFDEHTLRDALIRKMNLPPNPSAPPPSTRQ